MNSPAYVVAFDQDDRTETRARRLYEELSFALSRTDRKVLKDWGRRSAGRVVFLASSRVGGLARLLDQAGKLGAREAVGLFRAVRDGQILTHMGNRTAAAIDETMEIGRDGARLLNTLVRMLRDNPRANAPRVLGALLGFSAGSGGLDGDGGIPDLDLLFGVGAHRSPLTHTLIVGIVLEGLALALIDLATVVHERLPIERDPLWDAIAAYGGPLAESLTTGALAGIAYHLLVDAWVQPGALHGLPVGDLPMEAHQGGIGVSSATEAIRAAQRIDLRFPVDIDQAGPAEKSMGRTCVDAFSETAARGRDAASEALRRAFGRDER